MIPKQAKGKRPVYFQNPEIDQLLAVVLALAGEVSVLRERLDTVERLAAAKGLFTSQDIEAFSPDDHVVAAREEQRSAYIARILRVISGEGDVEAIHTKE